MYVPQTELKVKRDKEEEEMRKWQNKFKKKVRLKMILDLIPCTAKILASYRLD